MEHNYFILTDNTTNFSIERFHICTWEFRKNNSAIMELGGEIEFQTAVLPDILNVLIYIPWIHKRHDLIDLYESLKDSENCRFVFNDSVTENVFLDDGIKKNGVIQKFASRDPLCIMPIELQKDKNLPLVKVSIKLRDFKKYRDCNKTNIYFRFYIEPELALISTRKKDITRSSIIYDIKINEKRNLPYDSEIDFSKYQLCKINTCFFFNILPNSYNLTFFDSNTLKSIRSLEFESFKKYIRDKRVKNDELVVVFNKKKSEEGYAFFSMFSKERIGAGQFSLAVLVNLFCGILLFLPGYRFTTSQPSLFKLLLNLPFEVYVAIFLTIAILTYFIWPFISSACKWIKSLLNL